MTLSMTCEQFEDLLPQLLDDDEMPMPAAARLHLEGCVECRTLHDDLTSIRTTAASLPPITPSRDLWSGIEARIRTPVLPLVEGMPVARPRRQISLRAAAVAAGVLALLNAGVGLTYMKLQSPAPAQVQASEPAIPAPSAMRTAVHQEPMMAVPLPYSPAPAPAGRSTIMLASNGASGELGPDEPQQPRRREAAKIVYDREIARLRAIVDSGRHRLDPATAALLDRNLRIIDTAIEQCNEALQRDPSSTFLIESLTNAYQTKVKLLRIAAAAVRG